MILVDYQHDFVDPTGTLYVPGSQHDVARFLTWFYANAHKITSVYASLDTHLPFQIFYSSWWKNPDLLSRSQESGQRPETEARKDRFDDAGWGSMPYIRKSLNAFLIPTAPLVGPELDRLDFRMVFNIGLSPFSRCEI